MIELFNNGDTSATFAAHKNKLVEEINKFSDEKILGADFEEWTNYYFEIYKIQPIILFMDNVTQKQKSKNIILGIKLSHINKKHTVLMDIEFHSKFRLMEIADYYTCGHQIFI